MEPLALSVLVVVGVTAIAASLTLAGLRRDARRTARASRQVARVAGLTDAEVSKHRPLELSTTLRGRSGHLTVGLQTDLHQEQTGQSSVITIGGLADLSLWTEGVRSSLSRHIEDVEIHVGDDPFDDTLVVRGLERLVRAVLDTETRRLTLLLFAGRVEIRDQGTTRALDSDVEVREGVLRIRARNIIASPRWMGETLLGLLDVARRLAQPADVPGRLAANARGDPISAVRLANLRTLIAEYPALPIAARSLRAAFDDPDPEVVLWAATELGEEGRPVLRRIAANVLAPEKTRARALGTLGGHFPVDEVKEILSEALRARRIPVARAGLSALGAAGGAEVVDTLSKVLAVERGALAEAAADALGATEQERAEEPLVDALSRADEGVATAAAVALGRVGTSRAVPRLREVESTTRDGTLRRLARGAVARIHSRLTGAIPGQLSLADGDSGQLSLTEDESGRVSLPEDETPGDAAGRG